MKLVFMLEEASMKYLLDELLPRILPEHVEFQTIKHNGKSDLRRSLPKKLRGWNDSDIRFVVVHDQDNKADCTVLKKELVDLCSASNRHVLVRIACQELEAWYFGDIPALSKAYGKGRVLAFANKRKLRIADKIVNPKKTLCNFIPEHQQIDGAKRIGRLMDIDNNTSTSFNAFVRGVRRFAST